MAIIYKITNKINGKIYIGKTEGTLLGRFKTHIRESKKDRCKNRPLYSAINKYGVENFIVEFIEYTDNPDEREIFWIDFYQSYRNGYNATCGGDGKTYVDKSQIIPLFYLGLDSLQIADKIGCCREVVLKFLRQQGLSTKKSAIAKISRKVICIETSEIFESLADASAFLVTIHNKNCDPKMYGAHISACCRGKRKSVLGYSFKYQG